MKRPALLLRRLSPVIVLLLFLRFDCAAVEVGVARIDVTPVEPIRLTGYASRKTPSTGVQQKLWAKALAIGSDRESAAVLLTLDNCGIAEDSWREVRSRLEKSAKLKAANIVIASSHTHSGPATKNWAPNIFVQDLPPEQQAAIDRYTIDLIAKLEKVALDALRNRRPGRLSWAQGSVTFARNRRVVQGNTAVFGDNTTAPVDHSLPVLKAETADGRLLALVANYACHCTTLGGEINHVCGDWAGYAQEAIERDHPGAVALITIGCGADANPFPRGGADFGLALAKQHGDDLAAEVKRLIGLNFTPLESKLSTRSKEIALPFGPHFTRDQWLARSTNSGIVGYHAKKWLARLDRGEKPPDSLYYPITSWNFGDELALVFLPGEVVVDYALRLKRELEPQRLWVTGYANYVPCYIPSRRILAEGGYEAEDSLWYYDRPARISTNAEDLIIRTVEELVPKSFRVDPKKAELPDPKTPQQALGAFRTRADLTVELVASEPLIESPVAIDWDAQGRLWVCEMYDYPLGIGAVDTKNTRYGENPKAASGGYLPGGRIKVLTDTDGDGRYDKAVLFLDGLSFPTGVMPWGKGALICAAPNVLYAEDTDGDGRADLVRTNLTGFATHNFQARINGFTWGLDGWLHGSSGLFGGKVKSLQSGREVDLSGRDLRYRPETGEIEPVSGISQYGRARDDFDNWFGNDNSTWLWHYPLPDHYLRRNPNVTYPEPRVNVAPGAEANKLFPASRTLERFNDPQMANIVTSACGPDIYRDVLLGTNYYGNAFICEPVHNLVRRFVLERDGVAFAGHRAAGEERSEFLASTDNWFRPVQVRTGPDGALYVVDMYRFVIEHARWIPPDRLKQLDVRAGADMGRIYRVYPKGAKPRPIRDLTKLDDAQLADALNTPNGPTRDLAHLELQSRAGVSPAPRGTTTANSTTPRTNGTGETPVLLSRLATNAPLAVVRAQAIACLANLSAITSDVLQAAFMDSDPGVRRLAIRAAEPLLRKGAVRLPESDRDPSVRFQLALSLGEWPDRAAGEQLGKLAGLDDPWVRAAVLSSASLHSAAVFKSVLAEQGKIDGPFAGQLVSIAGHSPRATDWQELLRAITPTKQTPAEPWQWRALASLMDALDRNHITALALSTSSWEQSREAAERIRQSLAGAHTLAANDKLDDATREAAIRLLGRGEGDRAGDLAVLAGFLQAGNAPRLQAAAIESLRRQRGPQLAEVTLTNWNQTTPSSRVALMNLLVSRDEWIAVLLGSLERGAIVTGEVSPSHRQWLLEQKDASLRERAAKVFGKSGSSNRAEVLAKYESVGRLAGVPEHGAAVFDKNCAQCHAMRGRGHDVGPNLAEFAGKSIQDFVMAVLDPNAGINPNFIAYNIETKDGRSLSGIVRSETASGLTLVQGGGVRETVLRSDIGSIRASALSLMPEGLEQAMTPQDVADLVAWLKGASPAVFGSSSAEQAAKARADFLKNGMTGLAEVVTSVEHLPYPSWMGRLPLAYCRQNAGQDRLVWRTAVIKSAGEKTTFRLPSAMGFVSQPQGKFTLKLNGQSMLDFDVTLSDRTWESADGKVRMNYLVKEANAEDSNGVLVIEVNSSLLLAGKSAEFEVVGSASNSQRWFGVYVLENPATARR